MKGREKLESRRNHAATTRAGEGQLFFLREIILYLYPGGCDSLRAHHHRRRVAPRRAAPRLSSLSARKTTVNFNLATKRHRIRPARMNFLCDSAVRAKGDRLHLYIYLEYLLSLCVYLAFKFIPATLPSPGTLDTRLLFKRSFVEQPLA